MASNFSSHYPSRLSYYPDLSTLPVGHSNVSASLRDSNHGYAGKIEMAYNSVCYQRTVDNNQPCCQG